MQTTADQLEKLAETHELTTLTEEEGRMIYAFRLFKDKRLKPGTVFTWQTHPEIEGGELPSKIIKPSGQSVDMDPAAFENWKKTQSPESLKAWGLA